ncbi:MAG: exosortase E/protease, VPEID-CTERM system [Pseudomonadota bacterium]
MSLPEIGAALGYAGFVLWAALGMGSVALLARAILAEALAPLVRALAPALGAAMALAALVIAIASQAVLYWDSLSKPTLAVTSWAIQLCCGGVRVEGDIITMDAFRVRIDATCSGIEGMVLITLFLSGYLYVHRRDFRFPRALIALPAGLVLSFAANIVRLVLLIIIGARIDPVLAGEGFHSMAGWIFFCLLSVVMMASLPRIAWLRQRRAEARPTPPHLTARTDAPADDLSPRVTIACLLPFALWLAAGLLTAAVSVAGAPFYALKAGAAAVALWLMRDVYRAGLSDPRAAAPVPTARAAQGGWWPGLAPWVIGLGVYVFWMILSPLPEEPRPAPPVFLSTWPVALAALWVCVRVIGSVLVVPVIEELAFRGYLQRRLMSAQIAQVPIGAWTWMSALGTALAFGLLHGNWIAGVLAGLAFAWAARIRGRLRDAILAHALANALIAVSVLALGRWDLW